MAPQIIFFISFSILSNFAQSQEQVRQIEFTPFVRIDKFPQFLYIWGGRPSTDYVSIKGTSFGLSLAYKIPITKSVLLKPGIGFYKYLFDNIKKVNTLFGKSNARHIGFVSPLCILFYSNKYSYNTISANIGVEKIFNYKSTIQVVTGLNLNNYYVVSEYYHLSYNPIGSQDYRKKIKRYFGSSFNLNAGILKKYKKVSIGPSLMLPVFDTWKKDDTFPEEANSGSRSKWFNGIGLGISFNYLLTKKQ